MVVAIFLRSWDLGWNGFNGDESIYSGQAASLLGERDFLKDFAVFRAHPLFLQSLVSAFFALFGIHDTVARLVPVIFGSLTVFITYLLAKELFNRNVALISSLVLALLPFHIVFSRQVLLDVPLSFFVIVFLYFMYKYRITQENIYSYLTGVACGFCFISKEVGLITLPIFITYSVLTRTLKLSKLGVFLSGVISGAIPFFLLLLTRHDFVNSLYLYGEFQASREATIFSIRYSSILLNEALGYVLFILIVISVILLFRELKINKSRKFRDQTILLVLSLGVIFIFYQLLPSKGDRFMITLVPIGVILGCSFFVWNSLPRSRLHRLLYLSIIPLIILSNNFFLSNVLPIEDLKISDNQGTPWNREVAIWIKNNTPSDYTVLTADRKLGNIIGFYSHRDVYTVQLNPNPSYLQVQNSALLLLNKNVTIIVEDLDPQLNRSSLTVELRKYIDLFKPELVYTAFREDIVEKNKLEIPIIKVYKIT